MDREEINPEGLDRTGSEFGDDLAEPEATWPDEDRATGSEGAGRLIGLGEPQGSRQRVSGVPSRLPD